MPGLFSRGRGGGASIPLDMAERSVLRNLTVQLLELVGPGEEEQAGADPLAGLLREGPSEPPKDPALARLFPDAYADDEKAASEFRRFTELDLRERKRADALAVVRSIDEAVQDPVGAVVVRLDPELARHWLGTLNDLRLVLGARLGVTEEEYERYERGLDRIPEDDPNKPLMIAYLWLGQLQETLIGTMRP